MFQTPLKYLNNNKTVYDIIIGCFWYLYQLVMPYVFVKGSLNSGNCGVTKVNTTNNTPIMHIIKKASHGRLQRKLFL